MEDLARAAAGPPTQGLAEERWRKPFKWRSLQGGRDASEREVMAKLERLLRQPQPPEKWKKMMPDRLLESQEMRTCLDIMDRPLGTQCP